MFSRRTSLHLLTLVFLSLLIIVIGGGSTSWSSGYGGIRLAHAADYTPYYPCNSYDDDYGYGYNIGGPSWANKEVDNLEDADYSECYYANPPVQDSSYKYVTHYNPGTNNLVYTYFQQNTDGYVQESVNGPTLTAPDNSNIASQWYGYWQMNPPSSGYPCGYFMEQVNTYNGGPFWQPQGGGYCQY